ncbi:MAG: peptide deformylase [Armatimonadetes bacterium]|nr:peptide deformylase [Armatimonadota bacterium]
MAIRPVILYPDPRLKVVCPAVEAIDDATRAVAQNLLDTMDAGPPRTVGIAAPQIGASTRVVLVDTSRSPKHPGGHGLLALVNPRVIASEGDQFFREGCLSIPDYTANIRRRRSVTVEALTLDGEAMRVDAEGFEAVVLQHEIDHLDGILFLDRVSNVKTDLFQRKVR